MLEAVNNVGQYTFRLFDTPTVLNGAAELFDFRSELEKYNTSASEANVDIDAINSDWVAILHDISWAAQKYELESNLNAKPSN